MTRNEYERTIQNQKQTIDQLETKLRELGEQFAEAAKAPPEGCKRGAWCRACGWNKPIVVRFNGYGAREIAGVCMKGCCESFIEKVVAEDK